MELAHPLRLLTPTVDGDVLTVLARADTEFTPPQVTELAGQWSVAGVRRCLRRLVNQGIVLDRSAGRGWTYRLNRDHLAAPAVTALAKLRDTFIVLLRDALTTWELPCVYAALFGSAARGDMGPDSDIDLFIVRPLHIDADDHSWRGQVEALAQRVTGWTGNDTRILEYPHDEAMAGLRAGELVFSEIARDAIHLAGRDTYLRVKG